MNSEMMKYLAITIGGLFGSLGLVSLSRHLRTSQGERKIKDEVFRSVLEGIQSDTMDARPGNKYDADILLKRIHAFIELHNKEFSNQSTHFVPYQRRIESALSDDANYTTKMKIVRSTCTDLLGRIDVGSDN